MTGPLNMEVTLNPWGCPLSRRNSIALHVRWHLIRKSLSTSEHQDLDGLTLEYRFEFDSDFEASLHILNGRSRSKPHLTQTIKSHSCTLKLHFPIHSRQRYPLRHRQCNVCGDGYMNNHQLQAPCKVNVSKTSGFAVLFTHGYYAMLRFITYW